MKIAVIGAGPVGLMAAIFAKTTIPNVDVTVYERRSTYKRLQVLLIQPSTLKILPTSIKQLWSGGGCHVMPPRTNTLARCYKRSVGMGMTSTTVAAFEEAAKAVALSLNVHFRYSEVKQIPVGYDAIIAADGANSIVSQLPITKTDKIVSYGLGVILKAGSKMYGSSQRKPLDPVSAQNRYRAFRKSNSAYLGIQIGKKSHDKILASQAEKYEQLPFDAQMVVKSAAVYYNFHGPLTGSKVFTFPVALGYTSPAALLANTGAERVPVYIVGDALARTHFFSGTGVNLGIQSAKCAVEAIAQGHSLNSYTRCITPSIQASMVLGNTVAVNFDSRKLHEACSAMTVPVLRSKLADRGIKPKKLLKQELCYLLNPKA